MWSKVSCQQWSKQKISLEPPALQSSQWFHWRLATGQIDCLWTWLCPVSFNISSDFFHKLKNISKLNILPRCTSLLPTCSVWRTNLYTTVLRTKMVSRLPSNLCKDTSIHWCWPQEGVCSNPFNSPPFLPTHLYKCFGCPHSIVFSGGFVFSYNLPCDMYIFIVAAL